MIIFIVKCLSRTIKAKSSHTLMNMPDIIETNYEENGTRIKLECRPSDYENIRILFVTYISNRYFLNCG